MRNMPRRDGTGPQGEGPRTGGGFGPCGTGLSWGRRFGAGRGMGRRFGWNWPGAGQVQSEDSADHEKALEKELEMLRKRKEG